MEKNMQALKPEAVWRYFSEICAIPHPSRHEEAIREYLMGVAKKLKLDYTVDEVGNVIIRKPATPGMEGRKVVVMQTHMDMVPQKNQDKEFDFTKQPIEAHIAGEWVKANGTTLGSDNGVGVAATLAVLENTKIKHGPLEALITASEEVGMDGAFGLKKGLLQADIMLNLDSETEGELCVGCAGGEDATATFTYREVPVPTGVEAFKIVLKGLKGGHSGVEINLERGNANKLMNRWLLEAQQTFGLRLCSIDGGGLRNAIPRESTAIVVVEAQKSVSFLEALAQYEATLQDELKGVDDDISIKAAKTDLPAQLIDSETQSQLLKTVAACPNGIVRMSPSIPGLVQTSNNLARVISEKGTIMLQNMLRSSCDSEKVALKQTMKAVFDLGGAESKFSGAYNGWNPNPNSAILQVMIAGYRQMFQTEPTVKAIHAGLECGILGGTYPNLDMISFGPTIRFPHSPDEQVHIESVEKFWNYLCHSLENIPQK